MTKVKRIGFTDRNNSVMIDAKNCSIIFDFMDMYVGKKALHEDVEFMITLYTGNEYTDYRISNIKTFNDWLHDIFFEWIN